ncbi:amidase [Embleya sp. NPDC050154]|uniref:amidase n=1 Tax=unclassified Embleya TaxID=2699296 RepID=UPI0037BB6D23
MTEGLDGAARNHLEDTGIAALGSMLADGLLSSEELCRTLLHRARRLDPQLNAFISLAPAAILSQARAADEELRSGTRRGPLHGVPIAVKDNIAVRGEVTTAGSKVLATNRPAEDAVVVERLRAAGAIIFGKTNLPELAYGPLETYPFGSTKNPWDRGRYAGGSSVGSGAALAAHLVPGALGTDTTGSIRNPAAWCGVVGLKPTYGSVPLAGVWPLARSLDHVGPMARSARDCALLLDVIADPPPAVGPTARSGGVPPSYTAALEQPVRDLRVGILRGTPWEHCDADVAGVLEDAFTLLGDLGMELIEVELPSWEAAAAAVSVILTCEASVEYAPMLVDRAADLTPQVRERLEAGLLLRMADYAAAREATTRLASELKEAFSAIDVLALPTRAQTPPRVHPSGRLLDPLGSPFHVSPFNAVGLPALTIPCGFDSQGIPVGLQLAGPHWSDGTLLAVADTYQKHTDWHTRAPNIVAADPVSANRRCDGIEA